LVAGARSQLDLLLRAQALTAQDGLSLHLGTLGWQDAENAQIPAI
jgi:hypothetical protein